jgi:hypothetical protein
MQDFSNKEVKQFSRLLNNKYTTFPATVIVVILKVKLIFIIPLKLKRKVIVTVLTLYVIMARLISVHVCISTDLTPKRYIYIPHLTCI